jgi:hypothetical protein
VEVSDPILRRISARRMRDAVLMSTSLAFAGALTWYFYRLLSGE